MQQAGVVVIVVAIVAARFFLRRAIRQVIVSAFNKNK